MTHSRQRGFTIVSAIFILVVLAALGAFIVTLSTTQQIGSALDVQGARTYQAARAGIEWGLYKLESTPAYNFGHANIDPDVKVCPATTSFQFAVTAPTLAGLTVSVTCSATTDPGGFGGPTVFRVQATACNQPDGGGNCPNTTNPNSSYIERRLEVSI